MLQDFISQYGIQLLYTALTAIAGYIGLTLKTAYQKFANDKTKQAVVKTVVGAVEQLYRELDGEGKLNQAISAANDMLAVKNIEITELELRMLIEAAVGEFNKNIK